MIPLGKDSGSDEVFAEDKEDMERVIEASSYKYQLQPHDHCRNKNPSSYKYFFLLYIWIDLV